MKRQQTVVRATLVVVVTLAIAMLLTGWSVSSNTQVLMTRDWWEGWRVGCDVVGVFVLGDTDVSPGDVPVTVCTT